MIPATPPIDATTLTLLSSRSFGWRRIIPGSGARVSGRLLRFLAHPRWLVVPLALEPDRTVLLLHDVPGVVVRVPVALPVPGLLQMQRHGIAGERILRGPAQGGDHAVRFRGPGQVDGRLGQVEAAFGH